MDYIFFGLVWAVLKEDTKYPIVLMALEYAKIGLALLAIVAGFFHGALSTWSQIRFDIKMLKEE